MFEQKKISVVTEDVSSVVLQPDAPRSLSGMLFTIDGRINRKTYFFLTILHIAFCAFIGMLFFMAGYTPLVIGGAILIWSIIAVSVKRLHDLDASGFWLLLGVIPVIGYIQPIYLLVKPGTNGVNKYGKMPITAKQARNEIL